MIIWLAMLIPITVAIICLIWFKREVVWWEIAIIMASSCLVIFISKLGLDKYKYQEDEYWGTYVVNVCYEEPWTEYVHRTCSYTVSCGKGCETTVYYDCSYYDNHPAEYYVIDNIGESTDIDVLVFNKLAYKFGNKQWVNMHRASRHDMGEPRCKDGNMYQAIWDGSFARLEPLASKHTYTNNVVHTHSVFNFPNVSDTLSYLFPKLSSFAPYYNADAIRGYKIQGFDEANELLKKFNGLYGHSKEVRMQIILYHNQPKTVGEQLEWYWKGGNMNEFNVVVSLSDSSTVQWVRIISWTEIQDLKIDARNMILSQSKFDLINTTWWLGKNVERFQRKDFERDFSYLQVDPPTWTVVIVYIFIFILNVILVCWSVLNDFENDNIRDSDGADRIVSKMRGY